MTGHGKTAARVLIRGDLRGRWLGLVAVALLMGIAGGLGLASIAGARRTATLFERHLEASRAADVEIDPGTLDEGSDQAIRALPGVEEASWWATISAYPLDDEGRLDEEYVGALSFTTDGRYLDMDRVALEDGRLLDPEAEDEVLLNPAWADALGIGVGAEFPLGLFATDENGWPTSRRPDRQVMARVVGIMALNEDVTGEELDNTIPRMFVSPAFDPPPDAPLATYYGFAWYGLRLENGRADEDRVIEDWQAIAAEHNAGNRDPNANWLSVVHRASDLQKKADRAVRPLVVAVGAFGLLLTFAAALLGAQALIRTVRVRREDLRIARILGLGSRRMAGVAIAGPGLALGLGGLIAAGVALGFSASFPIGPFTVVEPDPGRQVDVLVLGLGLGALVLIPLAVLAMVARHEAQTLLAPAPSRPRPSRALQAVTRSGAPEPIVAAVRLTVDPGRGRSYVPTRSVLVSTTVVVIVLVTTIVFGANLQALGEDPEQFGWRGDAVLMTDGGYGTFDPDATREWLTGRPEVEGWRLVGGDRTSIDGRLTPGLAYGPSAGVGSSFEPVLTDGRAPATVDEVVLGAATLEAADVRVGDEVALGSGETERAVTVVGTAVFPVFGPALAIRTGLDTGVWMHPDAGAFDFLGLYGGVFNGLLVDVGPDADLGALDDALDTSPLVEDGADGDAFPTIQPTEVRSATDAVGYRTALILVLGSTAALSVMLTLAAVVRRRRADLGIYRCLGFTPRQLRASITAQGLLFALAALAVGTPVGIVLGRELWRRFAEVLGTVPGSEVPGRAIALAGAGVVITALLSAVPPAVAAGRRHDAELDHRD